MKNQNNEHEKIFNDICEKLNELSHKKNKVPTLAPSPSLLVEPREYHKSLVQTIEVLKKEISRSQQIQETIETRLKRENEKYQKLFEDFNQQKQSYQQIEHLLTLEKQISLDAKKALSNEKELGAHYLSELESERQENESLKEQVMEQIEKVQQMQSSITEKELEIASLKEKLQVHHQKFTHIEESYVAQFDLMRQREMELEILLENKEKSLKILNRYKKRIKFLWKKQVQETQRHHRILEGQILEKLRDIEIKDVEIQRLNNIKTQSEKDQTIWLKEKQQLLEDQKINLSEVNTLKEDLDRTITNLRKMENELDEHEQRGAESRQLFEDQIQALRSRETQLHEETISLKKSLNDNIEQHRLSLNQITDELQDVKKNLDIKEKELQLSNEHFFQTEEKFEKEKSLLQTELTQLQKAVSEFQLEKEKIKNESLQNFELMRVQLQSELDEVKNAAKIEKETLLVGIQSEKSRIDLLIQQEKNLLEKMSSRENDLIQTKSELAQIQSTFSELSKQYDEVQNQRNDLHAHNIDLECQIKKLDLELDDAKNLSESQKIELQIEKNRYIELLDAEQLNKKDLLSQIQSLNQQVENHKTNHQTELVKFDQLNSEISSKEKSIQQLSEQKTNLTKENNTLKHMYETQLQKNHVLEKQMDESTRRLHEKTHKLTHQENELLSLTQHKEKTDRFINELLSERDKEQMAFEKVTKVAEDKIVELTVLLTKSQNENRILMGQVYELEDRLKFSSPAPASFTSSFNLTDDDTLKQVQMLHQDLRQMALALNQLKEENEKLKKKTPHLRVVPETPKTQSV